MGRIARADAVVFWRRTKSAFCDRDHRNWRLDRPFSSRYFEGDPRAGRFLATLFAFMGSMLGVVLADNIFALFVFWELTGFTSFLLIGFDQERARIAQRCHPGVRGYEYGWNGPACRGCTHRVSRWLTRIFGFAIERRLGSRISQYHWIAALVLLAAFTKSAQTPFHFWLPNAMAAPTPVSAYLHSATMVKAGLYLVARMTPLMGGTVFWIGSDSSVLER